MVRRWHERSAQSAPAHTSWLLLRLHGRNPLAAFSSRVALPGDGVTCCYGDSSGVTSAGFGCYPSLLGATYARFTGYTSTAIHSRSRARCFAERLAPACMVLRMECGGGQNPVRECAQRCPDHA